MNSKKVPIHSLVPNDILCRLGHDGSNYIGNVRLRSFVMSRVPEHSSKSCSKTDKAKIKRHAFSSCGRFLETIKGSCRNKVCRHVSEERALCKIYREFQSSKAVDVVVTTNAEDHVPSNDVVDDLDATNENDAACTNDVVANEEATNLEETDNK